MLHDVFLCCCVPCCFMVSVDAWLSTWLRFSGMLANVCLYLLYLLQSRRTFFLNTDSAGSSQHQGKQVPTSGQTAACPTQGKWNYCVLSYIDRYSYNISICIIRTLRCNPTGPETAPDFPNIPGVKWPGVHKRSQV